MVSAGWKNKMKFWDTGRLKEANIKNGQCRLPRKCHLNKGSKYMPLWGHTFQAEGVVSVKTWSVARLLS
jgi:hypothetical protein